MDSAKEKMRRLKANKLGLKRSSMSDDLRRAQEMRDQEELAQLRREKANRERKADEDAENRRRDAENERLRAVQLENARKQQQRDRYQRASKNSIARLRELMRERYGLDVELWQARDEPKADHFITMKKCQRADAALQEILTIVNGWTKEVFTDPNNPDPRNREWVTAKKIKEALLEPGLVWWTETPPWTVDDYGRRIPEQQVDSDSDDYDDDD